MAPYNADHDGALAGVMDDTTAEEHVLLYRLAPGDSTAATVFVETEEPARLSTTLYDLIAALHAVVAPDEDALVIATVVHLLRSGRITYHGDRTELDSWVAAVS